MEILLTGVTPDSSLKRNAEMNIDATTCDAAEQEEVEKETVVLSTRVCH